MEDNTRALELVCAHFKAEYGNETISNLRKRLAKAYRRNSDMKKELMKARFQHISTKLLNVFLLTRWRELVDQLTNLNKRIATM